MIEKDDTKNDELELVWQKASMLSSLQHEPIIMIEKAGFWRRFSAYSIDWIIIGIINQILSSLVSSEGTSIWGPIILTILDILIVAVYFIWPYSKGGQTLGKKILGIQVVSIDGSPLTWRKGISRTIGYIPSTLVLNLGFLWAIWDTDNQAWQDKLAGTLVLRTSYYQEQLQDYLEPAEVGRRQKRWLIGLGIPTALIISTGVIVYLLFILSGLTEVKDMGDWPSIETSPEQALDIDLSHLDLESSQVINAREEESWELGQYEKGVLISFESDGKENVYIWALRYSEKNIARSDFDSTIVWAEENCAFHTWRVVENSGILNCKWTDAYDKILLNQYWILDVMALKGGNYPPDDTVDQVLKVISSHWEKS